MLDEAERRKSTGLSAFRHRSWEGSAKSERQRGYVHGPFGLMYSILLRELWLGESRL